MYFDPELWSQPGPFHPRGAIVPWEKRLSGWYHLTLEALGKAYAFDIRTPSRSCR